MTEDKGRNGKVAGMDRRTFCIGAAGTAVLMGLGGGLAAVKPESLVRPPGGQDEDRLNALCVRCEKCLTSCPKDIIVPAHIENGFLTVRTPQLSFEKSYCDWCAQDNGGAPRCVQACPTGALLLPEGAGADHTVIGRAEIDSQQCLAWRMMLCKFCFDACPFEAIEFDDFERPAVIADACTGCGACEAVCVSLQNGSIVEGATERAITVRGLGWER